MGDFLHGALDPAWPQSLRQGIWLHRKIDAFTDLHQDFLISKSRMSLERRRLAGIILDIGYDHFLSRHWSDFCDQPREQFIAEVYLDLSRYQGFLPVRMERPLAMLIEQDWLSSYHHLEGVSLTLDRVARRFSRPTNLHGAGEEVRSNYQDLEQDFLRFFPKLVSHVENLQASRQYLHGEF